MKKSPHEFIFLKDEPRKSTEVSYKGFYHSSVVPALKKILKDNTSPHTIGLFGAWGTGKSTIVEMVQNDKELGLPVFLFDAWKYQEDTLRRTFLIKLVEFLKEEKYKIPDDILVSLYTAKTLSVAKKQKVKRKISPWVRIWAFCKKYMPFIVIVLALVGSAILVAVYPNHVISQFLLQLTTIVSGIAFLALLGKPILEGVLKVIIGSFFAKQEQQAELITEIHQEDRLNSPEQFEKKFIEILSYIDKKLVIVFDNIDRVQGDVAISMLSTIKTFMYSEKNSGLVFLVPCDPSAIEVQVEKYFYGSQLDGSDDNFGATEYLRKIFNLIVWIPDFINTDLEEYTKALISETGEVSKLLDDEDVVFVINSAFSKNPREIIQFINNLIAMVVSVQGTGVKDIINANIAYLAKVLVLRQKFPFAYAKLKDAWYNPEDIIGDGKNKLELESFMKKTSRITVDDAEPFIYFKDPAASRGLSHANEIKNALVSGNATEAIEAAQGEQSDKVIEFITDLISKYAGQENVLSNVVITQFELVGALEEGKPTKKYVNDLAKTIDGEAWVSYSRLPIEGVFEILSNKELNQGAKNNIIDRYITVLETDDGINEFKRSVIYEFKKNSAILTKPQKTKIRSVLESKYGLDEEVLAIFKDKKTQEIFVTEKLLSDYIESIDYVDVSTKLSTLSMYKEYILGHELVAKVVSSIAGLMERDTTVTSTYNENKAKLIAGVELLVQTFGSELKHAPSDLANLAGGIIKVIPYTSSWEDKADEINALYWLRNYVGEETRPAVVSAIHNYFQSISGLEQFQKPLNHWNEDSRARFIKLILPVIYPRLAASDDVLKYIYENADNESKSAIIVDLIDRIPVDNYYDINFIGTLNPLPSRKENIAKLLDKAGRNSYTYRSKYYDYIAGKILKSDPTELKTVALDQIKTLLVSNSAVQSEVGFDFFTNLAFLQDSDKRRMALEMIEWLREPGRTITTEHRVALQLVNENISLLQNTPKNDYVYLLFSLLSEHSDAPTTQMLISALDIIRPSYKEYKKDFDDLLTRMESWSSTQAKQIIHDSLPNLASKKASKAEQEYWLAMKTLYPGE